MVMWNSGGSGLDVFDPLHGSWISEPGDMAVASQASCRRAIALFGREFVRLEAEWKLGEQEAYRETAFFGAMLGGELGFWSFTSNGDRSSGVRVSAADIHPEAIGFEAQMPAGAARMVYWPTSEGGAFSFAVEARTNAGWSRFVHHRYRRAE
jgi:hypothetical protein